MATWDDIEIVTLAQAKQHLKRSTTTVEDDDLTLKLRQAHGLVLDYIDRPSDDAWHRQLLNWDDESAPAAVQAAILRQFGDLVRFRGDDADPSENRVDGNFLSPRVKQLLLMYRTPALA